MCVTVDLCYRTALEVWRLILEETEKLGKARLQVADIMQEQIAEPLKPYRMAKQQIQKRVGDCVFRGGGEWWQMGVRNINHLSSGMWIVL